MDKPKPNEMEQGSEELFKLQQFSNELRKRYDDIKAVAVKKTKELEKRIDSIKDMEREAVRPAEQDTPMTRHIRMLENRFDKALIKYNEAQSIRKTYEQIVKRLREERIGFDNQLGALEKTLKAKDADLQELILMSHDANHAKEMAKSELVKVDVQLVAERQQREKDLSERRQQVRSRQEMNAKMQHRTKMRRDIKSEAQGDLSKEQEGVLKTAVVANAMLHEQNEMKIREEQSRITSFEEAFQKIKEATGVSDVNQVIQKFMTQEDTNNNLKQLTKEAQARIDSLSDDREAARAKLEELKFSGAAGSGSRRIVDEYEQQLSEGASKNDRVRLKFERVNKLLITMKAGTEHLYDKLEGIKHEGGSVPMSDDTVVDVMAVCEQKLVKALEALGDDEESAKRAAARNASIVKTDISEHNVRIEVMGDAYGDEGDEGEEEDEDDEGDGIDDDVPDRDYVKNSSQQMSDKVGKKKKKGRFSSAGEGVPSKPSAVRGKAARGARPSMA